MNTATAFGVRDGEVTTELPAATDAGVYYIGHLVLKGPESTTPESPDESAYGTHGVEKPPLVTDIVSEQGGSRV